MPAPVSLTSFVTYNPIAVRPETTLAEAAQALAETGIHHWPVVDGWQRLVGIFSESDILQSLAQRSQQLVAAGPLPDVQIDSLSVQDCMSDVVESVTLSEAPRQVLRKLLDLEVDWLPVIQDEAVVGVTTLSDFLREFSYGQLGLSKTQVSDVMEPAELISGNATLDEACQALEQPDADCLGVVRGNFPLGVLTQRDVQLATCRVAVADWLDEAVAAGDLPGGGPRTVLELVSAAPTIRPGERLRDAATLMLDHNRQAIAVVNQANRMMGAVTERGILRRMHNYLI